MKTASGMDKTEGKIRDIEVYSPLIYCTPCCTYEPTTTDDKRRNIHLELPSSPSCKENLARTLTSYVSRSMDKIRPSSKKKLKKSTDSEKDYYLSTTVFTESTTTSQPPRNTIHNLSTTIKNEEYPHPTGVNTKVPQHALQPTNPPKKVCH